MYEHGMIICGIEHGVALVLLQTMVVGLGMDPMMLDLDLDIGLCSILSCLNLLET